MNSLILCEGHTDAILLSYYLSRVSGWTYARKGPKGLRIQAEDQTAGESAEWYRREEDYLLICAVGSKDRFGYFFRERIQAPLTVSEAFAKIALVLDCDEETEEEIAERIRVSMPLIASAAQCGEWIPHTYQNGYGQDRTLDFLLLIIPQGCQGALETLLLNAISEREYDRNIVEKSRDYVDAIAPEAAEYIGKRRLVIKAYLGVTWAIQWPQKVFYRIDEQIRSVPWEKSGLLRDTFLRLLEL